MRLNYYKKANFGDALNPMIFKKFLPDFFDENPDHDFFGIGSILGLSMVKKARHKIIFSSGFAYGSLPDIDDSYDIICVRGPLSAKALNIDKKLAIADGALLLKEFDYPKVKKEYDFSFMPHWESENKYPWQKICAEAGIHYVSPTSDPDFIIQEILKSRCVIAEAMHFAIVADTLRVPWIPIKCYPTINEFKWQDWTASLEMEFSPFQVKELYEASVIKDFLRRKSPVKLPEMLFGLVAKSRTVYEDVFIKGKAIKGFQEAKKIVPQLSADSLLNSKVAALKDKLVYTKMKYKG